MGLLGRSDPCGSSGLPPVAQALQEFDLALRGKKKRKAFMKDSKKKAQMTVSKSGVQEGCGRWTLTPPGSWLSVGHQQPLCISVVSTARGAVPV